MDIVVFALLGLGAVAAWLMLAASLALLAGRVIHERDVHDRPEQSRRRLSRTTLSPRRAPRPVPQH